MLEILIFCQKWVPLEHKSQHAVITHAKTSNDIKIPTFFRKKLGDDVILVHCPFKKGNWIFFDHWNAIRVVAILTLMYERWVIVPADAWFHCKECKSPWLYIYFVIT